MTQDFKQTWSSILALSFVSFVICFRQISAPVSVALPEELQSPIYVGRLGNPVSYNEVNNLLDQNFLLAAQEKLSR